MIVEAVGTANLGDFKAYGRLDLYLYGLKRTVYGGPFRDARHRLELYRVSLREEEPTGYDVWLPIHDFGVPEDDEAVRDALKAVLEAMLLGRRVYVGCAGGIGRTGMFLALLAKVAGAKYPVAAVREGYARQAVETREQEKYVRNFDVSGLRWWLWRRSWRHGLLSSFFPHDDRVV